MSTPAARAGVVEDPMKRAWLLGVAAVACGFAAACSPTVTESSGATTSGATTSGTTTSGTTTAGGGGGQGGGGQGGGGQGGGQGGGTTTSTNQGGGGAGGAGTGGGGQGGAPACNGPGPSGDGYVYVLRRVFLGDTDRDGTPNPQNGWKQYGMNLDGKVSDKASKDLCKPRGGASPAQAYPDGAGGIDNSFGRNILPIFLGLTADLSAKQNAKIAAGDGSFLLHLVGLAPQGDTCGLSAGFFRGSSLGSVPKFDGTDAWPVDPDLLVDPLDLSKGSKAVFPTSDLVGDTWWTTSSTTIPFDYGFLGGSMPIPIDHARITMRLDPSRVNVVEGTIGGIVQVDALVEVIRKVAGSFDPSLCSGATIDSIVNQLEQAADILADGTQDPGVTCDAISFGVGFEAVRATLSDVGPVVPPPPDPCAQ
jgi:hypothetical protein